MSTKRKMGNNEQLFLGTALLVIAAVLLGFLVASEFVSFSSSNELEDNMSLEGVSSSVVLELEGEVHSRELHTVDVVVVSSQFVGDVEIDDNLVMRSSDGSRMYSVTSGSVIASDMYITKSDEEVYMLRLDEKVKSVSS